MEITREVREYADGLSDNEKATLFPETDQMSPKQIIEGMSEMSAKFRDEGGEIYLETGE
jgi:phosphomethylpyrimidine synthase